ncbi:MAG TPA: hypothetical protein VFV93_07745, partial [Thermomicrobiales bacterium]|nr:hypothetical protein [Thermomicrobiales bacterium]
MTQRWKRGQTFIAILCAMLLVVTAACGSGDDDDNESEATTAATSTATKAAAAADTSPTKAETAGATATTAAETATATETEDTEPTATTRAEATATTPASDEATATSTATEPAGATSTAGVGDIEVPDFETLDPELLPNFTLTMNMTSTNMDDVPESTMKMEMAQSDVDTYHVSVDTDGDVIEFWAVDGRYWTSIGGEIVESPTGSIFSPSDILTTGELIPDDLEAREDGHEEVNGRQTTRWVIDGDKYVEYMNQQNVASGVSTGEMTDGSGEVTIWIDDELKIMIKANSDV